MILVDSHWDIYSAFIFFLASIFFIGYLSRKIGLGDKLGLMLYCYHTIFSCVYFGYVSTFGGDAAQYIIPGSVFHGREFALGTIALVHFCELLQEIGFSNLGIWLLFNSFGSIGLVYIASVLMDVANRGHLSRNLVLVFIFLPSVSFWSAGVGKDAISFMAIGLALYAALNFVKRIPLLILAIAFMLLVRPHMAGMMVIAVVISVALSKQINFIPRLIVGAIGLGVAAIMIPFALNYAGVSEDASNLGEYIDARANSNQDGGSSLDIASLPLPLQMFTYLFRPLPFEVRSITQLLASIDNMVLLYLCYVAFKARAIVRNLTLPGNRVFMWWYVLIAWVLLSMTTANLGIAMRQKWMFAPILIFLLISIIAASESKNK
ncbi:MULTISPECIES: hypothetical protein [unclassified Vibrio]|uniref:hypothetical protein n=1 Tax=unclassified Vibrio TaxID=2614977 RepID=UPI00354E3007